MSKTRPILFNGEMVRAILDGRKMQTRRPVKLKHPRWTRGRMVGPGQANFHSRGARGFEIAKCPFGVVGDRWWVRETFGTVFAHWDDFKPSHIPDIAQIYHHATVEFIGGHIYGKTRPAIHMPRWASRITLEITHIRVEQVQSIHCHDCEAEGVDFEQHYEPERDGAFHPCDEIRAFSAFWALWDSTNPKHPWDSNPWVWVFEFKRVEACDQA